MTYVQACALARNFLYDNKEENWRERANELFTSWLASCLRLRAKEKNLPNNKNGYTFHLKLMLFVIDVLLLLRLLLLMMDFFSSLSLYFTKEEKNPNWNDLECFKVVSVKSEFGPMRFYLLFRLPSLAVIICLIQLKEHLPILSFCVRCNQPTLRSSTPRVRANDGKKERVQQESIELVSVSYV